MADNHLADVVDTKAFNDAESDTARTRLQSADSRLQRQGQSSEARGRAGVEFKKVIEWLDSSVRWTHDGVVTTDEVNSVFGRVERAGIG